MAVAHGNKYLDLLDNLHNKTLTREYIQTPYLEFDYKCGFIPFSISNGSPIRSKLFAILCVNAFDLKSLGVYFFECGSFFEDSTNPNCKFFIHKNQLVVMTTRDIPVGQVLSINKKTL